MFFGKKLKELRLKHAKMGLHKFKDAMGTSLSVTELSDIEHGYKERPDHMRYSAMVRKALGISYDHPDWRELVILSQQPFVMQMMPENVIPSPLAHKSDGTRLTEDEFKRLYEHINNIAKEHNKKAREHNDRRK